MKEKRKKYLSSVILKFLFGITLLALWHITQILLDSNKKLILLGMGDNPTSVDRMHVFLEPINNFLSQHPLITDILLIISSAHIDAILIGMVLWGIFGKTVRPLLVVLFVLVFRQISQFLVIVPIPPGMIWHYPGFPSLIVTYHTNYDFFFSGHAAASILSVLEIYARHYKRSWPLVWVSILAVLEIAFVLSMRFHYTADVIAGIFAAVAAFFFAQKLTPYLDKKFSHRDFI
jgi:hypothetical protein